MSPIVIIGIVAIAVIVVILLLKASKTRMPSAAVPPVSSDVVATAPLAEPNADAYTLRDSIFSAAERSFMGILERIDIQGVNTMSKVRLADIFSVKQGQTRSDSQKAFNRISAKHVDFLLIRTTDCHPLL